MAGGLAALLDDVAAIAKLSASASTKAVGVVVDDTAVTPRYVDGLSPARELPIVAKIAKGSIINKLVFILPAALLLSQFAPFLLPPLLMLGGTYLCFEGAEKLYEAIAHKEHGETVKPVAASGPDAEKQLVKGAVTTDFILSTEIMVISLKEVASAPLVDRALALVVVAVMITALVYGVVAMIVKMDDVGLKMMQNEHTDGTGKLLVAAMPKVMALLSTVGIAAMLWVGGHILLTNAAELGWHAPYDLVHKIEAPFHHIASVGGVLGWIVNTLCSALVGVLVGAVVVAIMHLLPFGKKHGVHDEKVSTDDVALDADGFVIEASEPK